MNSIGKKRYFTMASVDPSHESSREENPLVNDTRRAENESIERYKRAISKSL